MGFSVSEVIVVLLVALLVIKPEQMPDVAFSLGRFASVIKRLLSKMKTELNELTNMPEKFLDQVEKTDERQQ